MKLTDKKTILSLATAIVVFFSGLFIMLDKGFDFWDEHIKAQASEVPEGVVIAPRQKIIADAEYHRIIYEPGLKVQQAK